jgi:hypothetical protein
MGLDEGILQQHVVKRDGLFRIYLIILTLLAMSCV